jgi:outer membrane protein OmpA-like peptidoglycan-associated protein
MLSFLALSLALHGCTTTAPARPGEVPAPPVPAPADVTPPTADALAVERQWLESWFSGTPVLIAQRSDGALMVDVPREFCFDSGRSNVKPALAAVLDKVAESLRRVPRARLTLVAAPGDGSSDSALAQQRAAQVRAHLTSRGAPSARLAGATAAPAAASPAVQLRMELPPR